MSTILRFRDKPSRRRPGAETRRDAECEIVIFPGVRIERQSVDLGHRLRNTAGRGEFNHLGSQRPCRTS